MVMPWSKFSLSCTSELFDSHFFFFLGFYFGDTLRDTKPSVSDASDKLIFFGFDEEKAVRIRIENILIKPFETLKKNEI